MKIYTDNETFRNCKNVTQFILQCCRRISFFQGFAKSKWPAETLFLKIELFFTIDTIDFTIGIKYYFIIAKTQTRPFGTYDGLFEHS